MLSEHARKWLGYPVELFNSEKPPKDYAGTIYRLAAEWEDDESLVDRFATFLENPASAETPAIIFGAFGEHDSTSAPVVEALVAARQRLPKLRGVFLGDILSEENEISWIQQGDVSPLFLAYPELEHFRVRGNTGLTLGRLEHQKLKSIIVETGGLSMAVVTDVIASRLPSLEHLELWLGEENYGWDGTVADLQPLLDGGLFPKLKYLGLRDSEIADEIAAAIADAPVLDRLETLDLSMGTLSDEGAKALLASPRIKSLRKLDLHYHFISEEVSARFRSLGIEVDVSDVQEADKYDGESHRYVAVSE
jgi:hypothetical protein